VGEEKPSLEETLAHYGVLGMKWGQSRSKATGTQIRRARRNLGTKRNEILDKRDDVKRTGTGKTELAKMQADFLKNPDRAVASRMTRGEKAVSLILFAPAGIASIATTSAVSRRIERKQDLKKYDKP